MLINQSELLELPQAKLTLREYQVSQNDVSAFTEPYNHELYTDLTKTPSILKQKANLDVEFFSTKVERIALIWYGQFTRNLFLKNLEKSSKITIKFRLVFSFDKIAVA